MRSAAFALVFLCFFICSLTQARAEGSYRLENKNAFTFSILDSALVYSINYDRIITDWLAPGIGFSYIGNSNEFGGQVHLYSNFYPFRSDSFAMLVSPGLSLTTNDFDIFKFTGNNAYGVTGVGFEFRKTFLFRAKLNLVFSNEDFFFPWPGISFGGAF